MRSIWPSNLKSALRKLELKFKIDWKDYWEQKTTPKHRRDTADFYEEHTADLKLLFTKYQPKTVLELCCGNGALYPYLGFAEMKYKGVDFSPGMLGEFAKSYQGLTLVCADVTEYSDDQQYDLILMEFATQHLEIKQLARVFEHVRSMMHSRSVFVCSSVPWKQARWDYYGNILTAPFRHNAFRVERGQVTSLLHYKDPIGNWYNPLDINRLADKAGLSAEYYGCHSYVYRFHVTLRLKPKCIDK
jgi:trans-aconitate methyltransferase